MPRGPSGLTLKQERFAQEYLTDFNGTQAAIRAGYSSIGAHVTGSVVLANPKVAREIERLRSRLAEGLKITQESVLRDLQRLAEVSESLKHPQMNAAVRAKELVGKHLGMFPDKVELTDGGQAERIRVLEAALLSEMGFDPVESGGSGENEVTASDLRGVRDSERVGVAKE